MGHSTVLRALALLVCANMLLGCSKHATVDDSGLNVAMTKNARPNIIFILVDDMGYGDVGFNGGDIATPHLDSLAASGVILDRNYVYPICSPTRAALLSGQSPLNFGIDGPIAESASLPLDLRLLPEYLGDLGYENLLVGKWHLGIGARAFFPISRGFDYHYGFLGGWIDFYTHMYSGGLDWQRNGESLREDGHATDLLSADAKRLIVERNTQKPFFLYLAYNAPHTPLQHTPKRSGLNDRLEAGDRAVYAEMVTQTDAGIGEILATLNAQGILQDTLVIFSSDNGGDLRAGANNGQLRGQKGEMLEGGTRVPGVVSWPGRIGAGRVLKQMIVVHDWLPTLVEAAGGDPATIQGAHGQSMWAAVDDDVQIERAATTLGVTNSYAVYDWPWKLLDHTPRGPDGVRSIRLFNVEEDPFESRDLASTNPEMFAALSERLEQMPDVPSIRDRGPRPGTYFSNEDGSWNFDVRVPETRGPWAEAARTTQDE